LIIDIFIFITQKGMLFAFKIISREATAIENLIHERRCTHVRKFLLGLFCCLLVVGVANMGHAFSIPFFSGSSGGKGGNGARPSQVQGAHYDFGFMQHLQNVPERPTKDGDGPVFGQSDIYSNHHGWVGGGGLIGGGSPDQTKPVPEPATMILLGIGFIGLAGYGRNKFRK
jgi:PEP-CTERM motif